MDFVEDVYRVTVPRMSLVQLAIAAAGNGGSLSRKITDKYFPPREIRGGEPTLDVSQVCFRRRMRSDDVVQRLDQMGLCPVDIQIGLAQAIAHPGDQLQFPVVILGSVYTGWFRIRYVACLFHSWEAGRPYRTVILNPRIFKWGAGVRFPAIPKAAGEAIKL